MDKTPLVGPDFIAGRELTEALERAGIPIAFAGWLNLRETFDWQLFIASPDVQTYGPTTIIRFVDTILAAMKSPLSLGTVRIVNTSNHFVNRIPDSFGTSEITSNPTRIVGLAFDDGDIVEGFVYKINKKAKASRSEPRANAAVLKRAKSLAA
ncbi:hypothetical protein [Kumtagia ephedrae]|uniref:Uncharacterized protein n=1 Tax=Kumtagia ephedrae TaxID=2116701 RepID=A0A2P7SQM8_9HYPH|nr:hypothetical protein [Mesorhizobium ephedrae]PSJ64768.1 hypothetical protein C7I84_03705 [Mesorhizobium ephedrae]